MAMRGFLVMPGSIAEPARETPTPIRQRRPRISFCFLSEGCRLASLTQSRCSCASARLRVFSFFLTCQLCLGKYSSVTPSSDLLGRRRPFATAVGIGATPKACCQRLEEGRKTGKAAARKFKNSWPSRRTPSGTLGAVSLAGPERSREGGPAVQESSIPSRLRSITQRCFILSAWPNLLHR